MKNTNNENENNHYRCNLTDCHHIEDLDNDDYVDSIEDGEYMDVPYNVYTWKETFNGVPTENLYWDNGEYLYMINNGKGLMFNFKQESIYHPTDPVDVAETYYRRLIMWENKQYDKLFAAGVPDDFKNIWFIDCVRDMPIEMIYPIYHEIFLKTQIELFGDSVIKKTLNSFDSDVQELIKESEKLQ